MLIAVMIHRGAEPRRVQWGLLTVKAVGLMKVTVHLKQTSQVYFHCFHMIRNKEA